MHSHTNTPHTNIYLPHVYLLVQYIYLRSEKVSFTGSQLDMLLKFKNQASSGIILHFVHPSINKCIGIFSRNPTTLYPFTNTSAFCTQNKFPTQRNSFTQMAHTTHKANIYTCACTKLVTALYYTLKYGHYRYENNNTSMHKHIHFTQKHTKQTQTRTSSC